MIFVLCCKHYLYIMIKVLFVCLGNICRSPLAEGLFLHKVQAQGLENRFKIDSCGTGGWHVGNLPDPRSQEVATHYGVDLPSRARKLQLEDFKIYDYILAMDRSNRRDLEEKMINVDKAKAQIFLMRDFDSQGKGHDVPDPYYGGSNGFYDVYDMLDRSSEALLDYIKQQHNI